ncbi:MAG: hypothetical protein Q8K75_12220 [Chlamydiales bacterium]|nr:hypothetical protein [Chlamydiales bacterium]
MSNVNTSYRFVPPMDLPIGKSTSEHTFINKFKNPPGYGAQRDSTLLEKIKAVAYDIFMVFIAATLWFMSQNTFVLGFICGVVWDETCHAAIEKIKAVISSQGTFSLCIMGISSVLAMTTVFLTTTFLTGASIGGKCHQALKFD